MPRYMRRQSNHMELGHTISYFRYMIRKGRKPFQILRKARSDFKQVRIMRARKKNQFCWPEGGARVRHVDNFYQRRPMGRNPRPFAYYRALAKMRIPRMRV